MCRVLFCRLGHSNGIAHILSASISAGVMALLLTGCAATPPKTGNEAVCADVFDLAKWVVYQRQHQDPWTQDRLQNTFVGVQGSGQLQQLVTDAFNTPYDTDDSIQYRSLEIVSFAQHWQGVCIKAHGDGFQPEVWPFAWRKQFVDNGKP